jgi:hypothetical protein
MRNRKLRALLSKRLIPVTGTSGTITYAYDGLENRYQQTVYGVTTTYTLDTGLASRAHRSGARSTSPASINRGGSWRFLTWVRERMSTSLVRDYSQDRPAPTGYGEKLEIRDGGRPYRADTVRPYGGGRED